MIIIYLLLIITFLYGIKFVKLNKDYLKKDTTTIINGLFVVTIFFSHFQSYIIINNIFDKYMQLFLQFVDQLMVTSFLFYSGYGIYESIKNKKEYMSSFINKRFIPTFVNFAIAIILFIILNIIIGNSYSIKQILLAFIGYESIGNSNWYMLAIFALYIFLIISFNNKITIKNIYRIILFTVLSIIYMFIINIFKDSYYVNTILCFSIGMWYSYFKNKIDKILEKKYYLYLIIVFGLFIISYLLKVNFSNIYIYNIYAIFFIILVVTLTVKIKIRNSIFAFFGNHVFWIYILQRIPMIILKGKLNNYIYFVICLVITLLLSYLLKKCTDKLWKKVHSNKT